MIVKIYDINKLKIYSGQEFPCELGKELKDLYDKNDTIFVDFWSYGDEYVFQDTKNLVFIPNNCQSVVIKLPVNIESVYFVDHLRFDDLAFDKGKEACVFKCDKLHKVYVNYKGHKDLSKIANNIERLMKVAPNLAELYFIVHDAQKNDIQQELNKIDLNSIKVEFLKDVDILTIVDKSDMNASDIDPPVVVEQPVVQELTPNEQEVKSQIIKIQDNTFGIFGIKWDIFLLIIFVLLVMYYILSSNEYSYKINNEIKVNEYNLINNEIKVNEYNLFLI